MNKQIHIIGGGTVYHVRNHLALAAPAYGTTARQLAELVNEIIPTMDAQLHLTKMADPSSKLETFEDLKTLTYDIVQDTATKIVFYNPAVVDFQGLVDDESGKYAGRLSSREANGNAKIHKMMLNPLPKLITMVRQGKLGATLRKDIFLVGFKTTCGATEQGQYTAALQMLKRSSANLVLANDTKTRVNMIVTPEEASYCVTKDRDKALRELVEMAKLRSHLTFTRSTIVAGEPVAWSSDLVPANLRTVVDHCIARGAYKKFLGVTAGHFAVKLDDHTFLTSRRKTDFNDMSNVGLVKVETDGPDSVIAYGSKPSVGGQSQRFVFANNKEADCIVHFHCPIKAGSKVPTVSQREFECGSHECGRNTTSGLKQFGDLKAVYLDNHGPNVVFNSGTDSQKVIEFIEQNFDLTAKTGGYLPVVV